MKTEAFLPLSASGQIHLSPKKNAESVIEFLATLPGKASLVFWERVNKAPFTEEDWGEIIYLGAEMSESEETQKELREKNKKLVELVRNTKYYQKHMNELFGRRKN
jgi:hypothetical protein